MYQGVVKIVKENGKNGNNMRIVNQEENGRALEYAVKMLEIPQKFRMDNLLASGKVTLKTIESLTKTLVKFHRCHQQMLRLRILVIQNSWKRKYMRILIHLQS